MNEDTKEILKKFFDWVVGNGPRPENEVVSPEPPPDLPFTQRPRDRYSRFREATLRERYNQWLELHGFHIFSILYSALSVLMCVVIVSLLLATVAELPPTLSTSQRPSPAHNEVIRRYVEHAPRETGAQNIVAGLLHRYRGFETFGESAVMFTSAVSVLMMLGASRRNKFNRELSPKDAASGRNFLQRGPPDEPILREAAPILIPVILMAGCAVIINGHISPGGGFAGGAILGMALILAANAYGFGRVHELFDERAFVISTSTALIVYTLSCGYDFFTGANQLQTFIPNGTIGNILSGGLILPADICLGFMTAGTLYAFYVLFSEGDM